MTKLGRNNPYSAWLISVQPDICKCLLFPLFVAFCDSVYRFSYVSLLPLFRRICRLSLHSPSTHFPNPLTLPLLGFSGKSQFFFNADRFCVQVPHPNAPSMPFFPSSCQPPGFSGKVSGLQLFFADQVLWCRSCAALYAIGRCQHQQRCNGDAPAGESLFLFFFIYSLTGLCVQQCACGMSGGSTALQRDT